MTILLPLSTRPSSNARPHRKFQNSHGSCGHSFLYRGQPLNTAFFNRFMVWSCGVENFTAARSMGVDMKWILRCGAEFSVRCSGLCPASLWHARDRASATGMTALACSGRGLQISGILGVASSTDLEPR